MVGDFLFSFLLGPTPSFAGLVGFCGRENKNSVPKFRWNALLFPNSCFIRR